MSKPPYPKWKDEAIVGQIEALLRDGAPWSHAAAIAGVHPATLRRWRQRVAEWESDADGDPAELDALGVVVKRLERAKHDGEWTVARELLAGGPDGEGKGWQRLAWWLERTNPEQFSVLEHFRGRTAPEPEANEDARHEKSTVDEIQQAIAAARTVIEAV